MTQTQTARGNGRDCGGLTRYTSQKLAAIWFANVWMARTAISAR
jgi:hypothetical protein